MSVGEDGADTAATGGLGLNGSYFDIVREQLQFWPYTIHQIDDTLDAGLIEARAKQLLFRAIHARNLTAFVGSGVSMSYGRLTWRSWENEQRRTVKQEAERFEAITKASLDWISFQIHLLNPHLEENANELEKAILASGLWRAFHPLEDGGKSALPQQHKHNVWQWLRGRKRAIQAARAKVDSLRMTFDQASKKGGHFPGGEELPVKFEIAQQLHMELLRHQRLFLPETVADQDVSFVRVLRFAKLGVRFEERTDAPTEGIHAFRAVLAARYKDLGSDLAKKFLKMHKAYIKSLRSYFLLNKRLESQLDFEAMAKTLLVDETPHALLLLRQGLLRNEDRDGETVDRKTDRRLTRFESDLAIFSRENQRRDIEGIRENKDRYRVLTPFLLDRAMDHMRKVAKSLKEIDAWRHFLEASLKDIEEYLSRVRRAGGTRDYLTPSSRYLVSLALCLSEDPFKDLGISPDGDIGPVPDGSGGEIAPKDPLHPLAPPRIDAFTSRRSILADRFDPMPKIHGELKVNRYITTNYDFEIERYFQDMGYRAFDPPPVELTGAGSAPEWPRENDMRSDAIGRVLRDTCFSPENAAQLTRFAMEGGEAGASVFHLHGRATLDDSLVITERDYMQLYLTDDRNRPTIDEGIQAAFSGAPLLFLGLGMEETDLLRPLRQFISNRDRTIGYTSMALLPAEKSFAARTKFAAALYMRYGVHTIFYGSGQITYQAKPGEKDAKTYAIDWLHRVLELVGALRTELDLWEKGNAGGRLSTAILKDLIKAVGTIGPDMAEEPMSAEKAGELAYRQDTSALCVLLDWPTINVDDEAGRAQLDDQLAKLARVLTAPRRAAAPQRDRRHSLRTCRFAPTRPSEHRLAHREESETRVEGEKYLGFYTRQLDRLLAMVLRLPFDLRNASKAKARRHCAPIRIALDGLHGAFITGSLNAALDGIGQEKRAWWKSWQEAPNHRLAEFQRDLPDLAKDTEEDGEEDTGKQPESIEQPVVLGTVFLRHKIDNVLTPMVAAKKNTASESLLHTEGVGASRLSKSNRTHVRAFDTFIAAVACTFSHRDPNRRQSLRLKSQKGRRLSLYETEKRYVEDEDTKRQLITVAARRGMGKGTFMSAFTTRLGQSTYKDAAWPQDKVFLAGAVHINLGFSPEIASTYDMLSSALIGVIVALDQAVDHDKLEPDQVPVEDGQMHRREALRSEVSRLSRSAKLKELFEKFAQSARAYKEAHSSKRQPRLLLNICAAELLFDASLKPKNREIANYLDLLFGPKLRDCPVDIVFLADDAKLGAPWSGDPLDEAQEPSKSLQKRIYLDRMGLDQFAKERIGRAHSASQIVMDETQDMRDHRHGEPLVARPLKTTESKLGAGEEEPHFIHFTRPVNTAWLMIDNFPVLAMALHLKSPPGGDGLRELEETKSRYSEEELDRFRTLAATGDWGTVKASVPKEDEFREVVLGLSVKKKKNLRKRFSSAVIYARRKSDDLTSELWQSPKLPSNAQTSSARRLIADRVTKLGARIVAETRTYAETNGSPRNFDEKELPAALRYRLFRDVNERDAEEWRGVRRGLGNSRFSLTVLLAAAENVIVQSEDPAASAQQAESLIIDTVARVRTLGQERRDQMVFETVLETYRAFHQIGHPDLDCDLHLMLIKHLGVIGTPVGSAVLVRLTGVRDYFKQVGIETETSRRRFLVRALTTMAHRGLIFRLDPHPRLVAKDQNEHWPPDKEHRFALHRVVQSYALNNLEAGPHEPVATNRFAPTIHAAMPSQGPTLSANSYLFLRSLIIGLSQYPDVPAADATVEPWLFTTNDVSVRVQAGRAAMSLARSNFTVAVLSRLAAHQPLGTGVQRRGHLETYRVRLRWLVRIAYELGQFTNEQMRKQGKSIQEKGLAGPHEQVNVLYRDEIVWLYNELGVIAMAQGALSDALGYLRQAAQANEDIEGLSRSAPIYNHIDLNHAVVQMERARFSSARRRLNRVKDANSKEKWRLYHIAEGYLCVVDHLQGVREGVAERFETVTKFLETNDEVRAASLFLLHRARFLAKEKPKMAAELVARARTIAGTAGHEDVRQHAELNAILLRVIKSGAREISLSDQRMLEQVGSFSRRMGIWSLSVDTLRLRADILLAQNEHIAAGRLLNRALSITKLHSMNLRLNTCLTTYGLALLKRGDRDGARQIAEQSLDMAKRSKFALEIARAQKVLRECEHGPPAEDLKM